MTNSLPELPRSASGRGILEAIRDDVQRRQHQPVGFQATGTATEVFVAVDYVDSGDSVSDQRVQDETDSGLTKSQRLTSETTAACAREKIESQQTTLPYCVTCGCLYRKATKASVKIQMNLKLLLFLKKGTPDCRQP